MVIAFLNQKGGAGKTTIATNVARGLQLQGYTVLLADADPQGSALAWRDASGRDDLPTTVSVDRDGFDQDIKAVAKGFDFTIIDGPARMDGRSTTGIKASDLVLVPVQPSAFDIWATLPLVQKIRDRQEITDGTPKAAFIVSLAKQRTRLAREAADALAELQLPVLQSRTHNREAYKDAAGQGLSVLDLEPDGPAAHENNAIITEILTTYGNPT